ncbi:MAG: DRTGG domain-containing protein [Candidatus Bipolaricaulota bacterium]|nr:DRTGG domain-containing protein [Candidatus Bipolaricaulota bacterium]MCS7274695.1 DRTGG domain-containing protein [Candidatus Bipolaricaulota bacterium]MDW8111626.1 DRTGG domain-containing protein [Candidatus Bipolaricaulota bacterium]MDW8329359.1 DRTGG domain-containing protein [Candidatus Bipolaricaulota bacterium]
MKRWIIASMRKGAGKTSLIVGLGKALGKPLGYIKPFGDRLLYRKKRLWDYDSALMTNLFGLTDNPDDLSLGFDHAKLRYMYDQAGIRERVLQSVARVESGKEMLFVEGGRDFGYGISIHLDALSLAQYLQAPIVLVVCGDEGTILDDIVWAHKDARREGVTLGGVIVNKVPSVEDFKSAHETEIRALGVNLLGVVPHRGELTTLEMGHLAENLFAKVIAGEGGLRRVVKHIFIGAMSAQAAMRHPGFAQENKLIITSGDRSDMILAALESNTSGVVITNNIVPSANIISLATERHIPLLLVPYDTYETAKRVEAIEPLLTKDAADKIALLEQLVRDHVDLTAFRG